MTGFIYAAVIFMCGGFCGFILAAFFAVGRSADEPEEFDGGFRANHAPPARTVIWGGRVEDRE